MKITINITTLHPDYPVQEAMDQLEDFIKLVRAVVTPEVEDAGRYPTTSITGRDAPGASAITVIDAVIEQDGIEQGKFLW